MRRTSLPPANPWVTPHPLTAMCQTTFQFAMKLVLLFIFYFTSLLFFSTSKKELKALISSLQPKTSGGVDSYSPKNVTLCG